MRKTAKISHYALEHENGIVLLYIDRNHESMGIFILESITVSSSELTLAEVVFVHLQILKSLRLM